MLGSHSPLCGARLGRKALLATLASTLALAGCETKSFFDPSEMGRYRKDPLLIDILTTLDSGIEEPNLEFPQATDVRPEDLVADASDYRISKNDLLQVSITDLVGPGVETFIQRRVNESGRISLQLIGLVDVVGLTEAQAEVAIQERYREENLIQNAQVSVVVSEPRGRTFSVLGSVGGPGEYAIPKADFRFLDALTTARDTTSINIYYAYIIRSIDQEPAGGATDEPPPSRGDPLDLAPRSDASSRGGSRDAAGSAANAPVYFAAQDAPTTEPAPVVPPAANPAEGRVITVEGQEIRLDDPTAPVTTPEAAPAAAPAATEPAFTASASDATFEFEATEEPKNVRVIRIPLERLKKGELKYNVIIRPGDLVFVPNPMIGEYYIGGHVNRPGVYTLTARNITLKQAVISAGMLDQVAIPWRTQVVRRLPGQDREIIARVDLDKIFAGMDPDIYLKPDDSVMVGTTAWAPFLATIRNSFRFTYGFGFLYDRNYAPDQPQ